MNLAARPGTLQHPRRAPAHRSVSLLHSPRNPASGAPNRTDSSGDSDIPAKCSTIANAPSSLQALGGKESSSGSSSAEKWFQKSNSNVRDNSASFEDNDPPFFMHNSSSSQTPPDAAEKLQQFLGNDNVSSSLHCKTGLLHLGHEGSSTEDFRSVIDDLTVENKKLKRRLKRYEKLQGSHLKDEKLFEVRIHGLHPDKKKELEETLRTFASTLGTHAGAEFPANGYQGLLPTLKTHKTTSSQASLQNTDSAYASMSASGRGSSGYSNSDTREKVFKQSVEARHQNIHSFLHHIPEGLMPHPNPANMSERAKKKLVVRRLEQIFAGKGAAAGGHQHPMQQQEVSQMAARAGRSAIEAQGQRARKEGLREAPIMSYETENPAEPSTVNGLRHEGHAFRTTNHHPANIRIAEQDFAEHSPRQASPEQRPTRPLDLDPQRAQVPAENMRYFRHLGFSVPDPESGKQAVEGQGFIYLNLLMNTAQLHTVNVTHDFVRKSLSELSDKFELSSDGRKVRWKGGRGTTRTSSSSGDSSVDGTDDELQHGQSPRKRVKLSHGQSSRSSIRNAKSKQLTAGGNSAQHGQAHSNKLVYTPLFNCDSAEDSDESSPEEEDEDSISFPYPQRIGRDSSAMASSGVRKTSTKKSRTRDDGPIVFYNNARFCTDLSGDRKLDGTHGASSYRRASSVAIGKTCTYLTELADEKRGPLAEASQLPEPMDLWDNPIPEYMELSFPPPSPPKCEAKPVEQEPLNLEVTGMGGVYPADNFAISVESRLARIDQDETRTVPLQTAPKHVPSRFAKILGNADPARKVRTAVQRRVLSASRKLLPPSELPPALSFMPYGDDSMSDDGSEVDGQLSFSSDSPNAFPPSAAPQLMEVPYAGSGSSHEEMSDEESDEESDSSLDLLAAAREFDPEAIRQKEREYDANMAERLAEEIPAGSSAATAGGGSGYARLASGVDHDEYHVAVREARHPGLRKANTNDSMKVQGLDGSSDGESDDDDFDGRS